MAIDFILIILVLVLMYNSFFLILARFRIVQQRMVPILFLAIMTMSFSLSTYSASFDCRSVSMESESIELAICKDSELSVLDTRLALNYDHAVKSVKDGLGLRAKQRKWIRHVRQCGDDEQCLRRGYRTRIAELQKLIGGQLNEQETGPLAWSTSDGRLLHPNCIVREWPSSDNYIEFERHYKIPIKEMRLNMMPYYRKGMDLSPFRVSWAEDDARKKISISKTIPSCIDSAHKKNALQSDVDLPDGGYYKNTKVVIGSVVSELCLDEKCENPDTEVYESFVIPELTCNSLDFAGKYVCLDVRFLRVEAEGLLDNEGFYAIVQDKVGALRILSLGLKPH